MVFVCGWWAAPQLVAMPQTGDSTMPPYIKLHSYPCESTQSLSVPTNQATSCTTTRSLLKGVIVPVAKPLCFPPIDTVLPLWGHGEGRFLICFSDAGR